MKQSGLLALGLVCTSFLLGSIACLSSETSTPAGNAGTAGGAGTAGSAGIAGQAGQGGTGQDASPDAPVPLEAIDLAKLSDDPSMVDNGTGDPTSTEFDGKYRDDLTKHPGCAKRGTGKYTNNLAFTAGLGVTNEVAAAPGDEANIPDYTCAAKQYTIANEDIHKPIVILVHGNSETVNAWESWGASNPTDGKGGYNTSSKTLSGFEFKTDSAAREMLAAKLVGAGYQTIAVDLRVDAVATLKGFNTTVNGKSYENPSMNIDHGWSVPIVQSLLTAVIKNNPGRKVALIGHSLGVTTIRDAIRRNFVDFLKGKQGSVNPLPAIKDVILLEGANHGVSTFAYCGANFSMKGTVTCQMGSRDAYTQTSFHKPLNGDNDALATPCGDGQRAFGGNGYESITGVCGGNTIRYTTVTMKDTVLAGGGLQDEFVSEASALLQSAHANNQTLAGDAFDSSGYFFGGLFANHYAGPRSEAGMKLIVDTLSK